VGGNSPGLAAAERAIGLDSEAFSLRPHPFGYSGVKSMSRDDASAAELVLGMIKMFWVAITRADIIHFNFGRTVFDPGPNVIGRIPRWCGLRLMIHWIQALELSVYRFLRKPVFVTYMGDDARQGDHSRKRFAITMADHVEGGYYAAGSDDAKRRRIELFNRYAADVFYLNPDLGWVLPGRAKFVSYASVDPALWVPVYPRPENGPHIVHAPSHRGAKGSRYVLEAVERLREAGNIFRFTVVEGMTHEEACRIYREADLVVDQLLAGWYGGFAVECMALGKPVVAYLRQDDLDFLPPKMRDELPLIQAEPDTIYDVLEQWINLPAERYEQVGMAGRAFVERWHDPLKVANLMKGCYQNAQGAPDSGNEGKVDQCVGS